MSEPTVDRDPFEVVAASFLARYRAGQRPGIEEYAARYPELADQIRALLPALVRVEEDLSIDGSSGAGGQQPLTEPRHVLATLAHSINSVPRVVLPETDPDQTAATTTSPASGAMPAPGARGGRYQLFGEIARGGMGAVLKGRDPDLGRDLAVKVLLESHEDKPEMLRRFVEEAQIGGQLQHPGIVPVYELGAFADRRPYFTMKLVRGRTLSTLLAERQSPAHDLPRLFSIFEAVCQTVAYSHARAVIHRDLKPSNVMVGSFGEVQVMDWGLAKVLKEGGGALESPNRPAPEDSPVATVRSGSDVDESLAGSVLGTPAYMAPEQAAGALERVDRRSDVFGLGSILCEILTGQTAYTGRSVQEVVRKALKGDTEEALERLDGCGAEAELIALARDCLAVEPEDRPRDAGLVAERMTAYLAGVQERVQAAERERAVAVARAIEERRRRKVQLALAASVLALTTLGGLSTTYYLQQRQAKAAADQRVVDQVTTLHNQAVAQPEDIERWEVALAAVEQAAPAGDRNAKARLLTLRTEIQDGLDAARRDKALLDRLADIRSAESHDEHHGSAADADYADAFREAGIDLAELSPADAGARIKARPPSVTLALAGALDDWAMRRRNNQGAAGATRLSAAARIADPDPWRNELRSTLDQSNKEARLTALQALARKANYDEIGPISLHLLGTGLSAVGDRALAEMVLRRAQERHPRDVWVNFELARVLEALSRRDEAIRFYTAARAIRPDTAHELAHALEDRGNSDEALAVFRDLRGLRPDNAKHLDCLSVSLMAKGLLREAAETYKAAEVALREEIRKKPDDAHAHFHLGRTLAGQGKRDLAIAEYRTAIRLAPTVCLAYRALGMLLRRELKDYPAAERAIRTAIRLEPNPYLAYHELGQVLSAQGKPDEAIAACREAIRIRPDFALGHGSLGVILWKDKHDYPAAEAAFREAIRLQPNEANNHNSLGTALSEQGKLTAAIAEFRTAIRLQPDFAPGHYSLGNAFKDQGKLDEAIAEYRTAIRLQPDHAEAHCNLGIFLQQQGAYTEGLEMLRKGHELGSRSPDWQYPSADWVAEAERASGLANRLAAVLRGENNPKDDAERLSFARIARNQGLCGAATHLWTEALASDPQLGDDRRWGYRYEAACAAALAGSGQGKDQPPLDDAAKATLRCQARDWLKAELTAWTRLLESGPPQARSGVVQNLQQWMRVPDLAGIRDAEALARLPADEQKAWRTLWADVDSLRKRAGSQETAAAPRIGTATARGQLLGVGDPAPKLDVKSFVKGEPIATLEPGRVYVVEFWATWCGPCRVSIPHLTELQKKHPDVAFIGVSIWEQDQNAVKPFVAAMGDQMDYRVASDAIPENGNANDGIMATTWMKAAGQGGIPTAFIIDKGGRIAWIGHPMSMNEPLEKIAGGWWALTAASARSRKESENRTTIGLEEDAARLRNEIGLRPDDGGLYSNYGRLLGYLGRHAEAIEACRKAITLNPNDGGAHYNLGNSLAAQGRLRDALAAFGEAQRIEPSLRQSRQWQLFYHAACAAARAAAGEGNDEPPPDDAAKVKLRRQTLDWLRAEYRAWDQLLRSGAPQARTSIANALRHWKQNSDLAGMRDDQARARLPEAERKEWQALWADVASLESRAATPTVTETKPSGTGPVRQDAAPGQPKPPVSLQGTAAPTIPQHDAKADSLEVLERLHKRAHELAQSKPSEAEPLFRQALEGYRKTQGPNGPLTLDLTCDLANLLSLSGRGAEGEPLFRDALEGAREQFGPGDHRTLGMIHQRAHALEGSEPRKAEPLFREALEGYRKTEGHEALTLDLTKDLASLLERTGRGTLAEPLFRDALEQARVRFGPANPQTAGIMASWGLSLIQQGKWTEAEPVLRESLAIRERNEPDEWPTFNTRSLLGGSLLGQKKYAEAEPLILSGYEGMKAREARIPPPGKPRLTEAADRVVKLYEAWGKEDKAAEWRARLARPSDGSKNEA
jgi:serine/threonine-protein kinase